MSAPAIMPKSFARYRRGVPRRFLCRLSILLAAGRDRDPRASAVLVDELDQLEPPMGVKSAHGTIKVLPDVSRKYARFTRHPHWSGRRTDQSASGHPA